jgi:Uma2 family endonuclease
MASNPISKITEEQYLAIDRAAELRSEFVDGEVFARVGVTNRHALLQRNLFGELYVALRGKACRPYGSDSRVKVSSRAYVYPDATVVCGKQQTSGENRDILVDPVAIFEVLSPSTEKYDRGVKSRLYRTIDSLRDYVLIGQEEMYIEQFTRGPVGLWTVRDYPGLEEELKLDSIGVAIPLRRIYDQVDFPPITD